MAREAVQLRKVKQRVVKLDVTDGAALADAPHFGLFLLAARPQVVHPAQLLRAERALHHRKPILSEESHDFVYLVWHEAGWVQRRADPQTLVGFDDHGGGGRRHVRAGGAEAPRNGRREARGGGHLPGASRNLATLHVRG